MADAKGNKWRLIVMFTMTFGFFLVEIVVGYLCNSMALVTDSFHMLSDVVALIVAFVCVKVSSKIWPNNTFGWARAEVLGAMVNAVFLSALCFSILVESVTRFFNPQPIEDANLLLIVGSVGLLVNLIGLCLFHEGHGHSHERKSSIQNQNRLTRIVNLSRNNDDDVTEEIISPIEKQDAPLQTTNNGPVTSQNNDPAHIAVVITDEKVDSRSNTLPQSKPKENTSSHLNIRGVFLHIVADALGSVVVIISACVIKWTNWKYKHYVDPALSIVMTILILSSVLPLLKESSLILLQSVPTHIKIDALKKKLVHDIEGVVDLHELHIWQLAGNRIIATAHIRCRNLADYMLISEKVKEFFHDEGIHSTTIQPEFMEHYPAALHHQNCLLECPTNTGCETSKCCGPRP